ncbi:protein serine/threonine phosphatase 2C [Peniophora sp. CONT]|nr:protein serine/threonine phosphatase 2C [Peniophora sp. CONT]
MAQTTSAPNSALATKESLLSIARSRLANAYKASSTRPGISAVSFQPLLSRPNQDRVATLSWSIGGQRWLFLVVCDGHAGSATSDYTARRLPARIHAALTTFATSDKAPSLGSASSSDISQILVREIEAFDRHIGKALKKLVPDASRLSGDDARALLADAEKRDTLQRANHGTTLAAALVNLDERCVWSIGLGDSTIAITTTRNGPGERPRWKRLNELHRPTNPQEYFRVSMAHPGEDERNIIRNSDRILGALSITRAIGDFAMKLPSAYAANIFAHLPTSAHPDHLANVIEYSYSPPYISSTPHVTFLDLDTDGFWERDPAILVFSDGVDAVVEGVFVWRPDAPSDADPVHVLSLLLQDDPSARAEVEEILGHAIQPHWTGDANTAVELLGHLVGGADVRRVARVVDQARLASERPLFKMDDTSIVVCDLVRAAREGLVGEQADVKGKGREA